MSVLPPMDIRYPFDPTGKSKTNYVAGEVRTLPPRLERIIVPAMGAFYANSLIVRHNTNELIRGVDYELSGLYHDATIATGKDVNLMIVFINEDIVGDVELYYQVVGGHFTGVWESVQQYVNVLLVDPRRVKWDDVLDKPHFFVPKEHFHDINDIYGLNHIIPKLEEIRQAVLRIRSKEMRRIYDHVLNVKRDLEKVTSRIAETLTRESERVGQNVEQINILKQQANSIRDRVAALENNTTVQNEIAKLKQKDIALTGSIDTLNSNLNGLTNTVNTHTTEINALKAKDVDYGNRITAVENKNAQQDTKLAEIVTKNQQQDGAITVIENKNIQQDNRLSALEAKDNLHDTKLAELVTKNNEQDNIINNLRTNLMGSITIDPNPKNWLTRNNNGLLALPKLSRDSGNLLSIREDGGIYYGITPPLNISQLYVDAERGSDTSGDGTMNSPYATIKKAVEISSDLAPRMIHVMEGQNHIVDKGLDIKNLGILITPYGPRSDATPQPIGDTKFVLKSIYNLNTRITLIPPGRKRANYPYISMGCIMNTSGYRSKLNIFGIKVIISEHPDQAIVGTPTDYNPSIKYSVSSENCIFSIWNHPIDSWFYNCGLEFPTNPDALKVSLLPMDNTRLGTFTCTLYLNELSGDFPIYKASNDTGKIAVYLYGIHGKTADTLIPDTETFVKYFPNTYIDSNLKTTPSNIMGVDRNKIPLLSSVVTKNAIDFVTPIDNNETSISSATAKKGRLDYTRDEYFKFNKPLYNSDGQLLKVSPDTGNKLIANPNGLFVAPTQEITVSPDANNIITMRNNGLYATAPQNAGLDFTALNNLPEKAWAKGTSFLAKGSDGQWHRVVTPEDLVQDIGVSISANTIQQNVGSVFNVKYIVTNSGVAKNTKTTLTIVLPTQDQRTAYSTSNYVETIQGADRFVKTSPTTWDIYGLVKGGTFTLTFNIVPTVFGTYQLGGQVSTTNGVDSNIANNNATLMLTANTTEDPNYVASVDCPLISGVNLADNKPITMVKTSNDDVDNRYWKQSITKLNTTTLANVRIRLNNCSSVICYVLGVSPDRVDDPNSASGVNTDRVYLYTNRNGSGSDKMSFFHLDKNEKKMWALPMRPAGASFHPLGDGRSVYYPTPYGLGIYGIIPINSIRHDVNISNGDRYANSEVYTFDTNTKILTFANIPTLKTAVLACRPNGISCRWQLIILSTYENIITKSERFVINGLNSNQYTSINVSSYNFEQKNISYDEHYYGAVALASKGIETTINNIEIRIQKGTTANFTITGPINRLSVAPRQGNISIVKNSNNIAVSVKATATSTDDMDMGNVKIKIIG